MCRELQGRETKTNFVKPSLGSPARPFGGNGESHKKLWFAAVKIKDDTLSTTLKGTKGESVFVRVSVFSPCLLKLCVLAACPKWCCIQILTEHSGVC